jgi:hypothetical protein
MQESKLVFYLSHHKKKQFHNLGAFKISAYLSPGIVFLKAEEKAPDSDEHHQVGKGH